MEGLDGRNGFKEILEKYKYALAVVLIGVFLLLLPGQKEEEEPQQTQVVVSEDTLEDKLKLTLSKIEGAGNVEVLLTRQTGEEILYQTDTEESKDGESQDNQSQTVIVTDQERNEAGLIRRTDPPRYLGALIICQGADSPQVRLAIVEAVSCVTGLNANQISVLKMK